MIEVPKDQLAEAVRVLREDRLGLSQTALADELGVSQGNVSEWENPEPWTPLAYPDGTAGEVVWGPPVSSLEQCREWLGEFQPGVEAECGEDCIYDMENDFVVCDDTID